MVCDSRAAAGKYTFADGSVYEGEFKDGSRNGHGEERGGRVRESSRAREDEG